MPCIRGGGLGLVLLALPAAVWLVLLARIAWLKCFLFLMLTSVIAGYLCSHRINVGTKLVILDRMEKFIDS